MSDERKLTETVTFDLEVDENGDSRKGTEEEIASIAKLESIRNARFKITVEVWK